MAQVRFYATDLRRKSASHTLLMAQVPPLTTDLLHSSHPPAPLTLQACATHPTDLRRFTPPTCTRGPTVLPGAITRHRTAPPHTTKCGGYYLTEPPPRRTRLGGWRAPSWAPSKGPRRRRLPSGNRPRARSLTPQVPVIVIPRAKPECISCLSNPAGGCSSPRERGERPPCGVVNTWPVGPQKCNSFGISRLPA